MYVIIIIIIIHIIIIVVIIVCIIIIITIQKRTSYAEIIIQAKETEYQLKILARYIINARALPALVHINFLDATNRLY